MAAKMTDERAKEMTAMSKTLGGTLMGYYFRWREESQFEDFNEYIAIIKKEVEEMGLTFIKMTQRPFGPVVKTPDGYTIHFSANSTHLCWNQLRDTAPVAPKKPAASAPVKTMYISYIPEVEISEGAFEFKPQEGIGALKLMMERKKKFWSYAEVARALKIGQKVIVEVREKVGTLDLALGYGEVERTEEGYIRPRHLMQEY